MQTQNYDEVLNLHPEIRESVKAKVQRNLELLRKKAGSKAFISLGFEKLQLTINSTEDLEALLASLKISRKVPA